ncbi:MAG: metalloregulator ArsR/SmtB family transcription factor [Patescibacteria group bacterium]
MENKDLVKIFKAIANERRFLILKILYKNKEVSVGNISEMIDLSFRSVSKHLGILANAGLVECRQSSLNRYYSVNKSKFPKQFLAFFES